MFKFIYPIKDFITTAEYRHLKLLHPNYNDDELAVLAMYEKEKNIESAEDMVFAICMKDFIKKEITSKFQITNLVKEQFNSINYTHDGVYDIWLRNMKNVTSIKLISHSYGILYEISCDSTQTEWQIPLAFSTGSPVTNWWHRPVATFIPTKVFERFHNDDICIEINEGGSAEANLSTIRFTMDLLKWQLTTCDWFGLRFYVNGKEIYISDEGKCSEPPQPKKKKWWCF